MADTIPFLILAAERTGSNLLMGLLDSHPAMTVGGEFFNPTVLEDRIIVWPIEGLDLEALNDQRAADPIVFLDSIFQTAVDAGREAAGFKLLYYHGETNRPVLDHLVASKQIKVIHLKRRNLLRRYLSNERAKATGVWAVWKNEEMGERPKITLDLSECVRNFQLTRRREQEFDALFADHEVLQMTYEELAADPGGQATEACRFLGVEPSADLKVRYKKAGGDSLRDAIENFDEMKSELARWLSFFED